MTRPGSIKRKIALIKRWHTLSVTVRTDQPAPPLANSAQDIAAQAAACTASPGHLDELRGTIAIKKEAIQPVTTGAWSLFLSQNEAQTAADLDQRYASLQRQIRDNGVTYNVYADENGPQRPWSLDLFPLLIEPEQWQRIEAGVLQRMQLLVPLPMSPRFLHLQPVRAPHWHTLRLRPCGRARVCASSACRPSPK